MKGNRGHWIMAAGLVGVLAIALAPLPPTLFDLLIGVSLCISALTFLVAFYVEKPTQFSAFPSLLLFVTLFRLALNVASTRLILTGEDKHAAGAVVAAFGDFVIGGNFVVGAVVFLILVIVNFIVITKGAERISEVSARFTLDSMPGKQMAIDADLGAGMITEKEARTRRKEVQQDADFHGAMDGASKFVRGDAIAGLIVLAINVVGGFIIGVAQKGMGAGEAAKTYTLLSIGDGLVAQIPALLVSTGAALLTTRGEDSHLGKSLGGQLFTRKKPLQVAAALLAIIGLLPGMPHLVFLGLAAVVFMASRKAKDAPSQESSSESAPAKAPGKQDAGSSPLAPTSEKAHREDLEATLPVELLTLEVGLDLLGMVDAKAGGELLSRITATRKQLALDLGIIIPPVHIRDDLRMRPGAYRLLISGVEIAAGEIQAHRYLAIDPTGSALDHLPGVATTEPTFGLPAKWLLSSDRTRAEAAGCTVVDGAAVIATHITEILRRNGHELLGRREAQELLDIAAKHNQKVVEELIPHMMSVGQVIQVLRNLLREGVSVRDMRTILEALADHAHVMKNPDDLTEAVRQRLARRLTRAQMSSDGTLRPIVLDPRAEALLRDGTARSARGLSKLTEDLANKARDCAMRDEPPIVVVAPDLRRAVAGIASRHVPGLAVMSYREVDPSIPFITRAVISAEAA
jgi:flagellar biosynthesis protein FlhA